MVLLRAIGGDATRPHCDLARAGTAGGEGRPVRKEAQQAMGEAATRPAGPEHQRHGATGLLLPVHIISLKAAPGPRSLAQ